MGVKKPFCSQAPSSWVCALTSPTAGPRYLPHHRPVCLYRCLPSRWDHASGAVSQPHSLALPSKAGPSCPPLPSGWISRPAWARGAGTTAGTGNFPADPGQGHTASGRTVSVEAHPCDMACPKDHTSVSSQPQRSPLGSEGCWMQPRSGRSHQTHE